MPPPDGAAEVRRLIEVVEDERPEPPRRPMRELPTADPYPIDALGDVLGVAARAIHDRVRAPPARAIPTLRAATASGSNPP
jgi:hypothetical protein